MIIIEGKKNCNSFAIYFLATIAIAQLSIDLPGTIAIDKEFTTNAIGLEHTYIKKFLWPIYNNRYLFYCLWFVFTKLMQ